jgi:nitrite reductase/ring-hydroxylating ferredoxin subunit
MGKCYDNPRKPERKSEKVTVGGVDALPPGRGATVELNDGSEVALFNVAGKFYAIENFCPHKAAPLADSRLYGQIVECELHNWRFDVTSGECFTKKGCSIESYEVVVEDEMIKIVI